MTGEEVVALFKRYDVIDYVMSFYDSLHTTGWQYTIEDIDEYIIDRRTA